MAFDLNTAAVAAGDGGPSPGADDAGGGKTTRMVGQVSITERTYRALKERILSGAFAPGARIDANELAAADRVSPTPVRHALNRLVGDGLLVAHSNEGFHVPPFAEEDLRNLYDCCAAFMTLAIARAASARRRPRPAPIKQAGDGADIALRTEHVFVAVMSFCPNRRLREFFADASLRLRPARLLEGRWIADRDAELARIAAAHEARDLDALSRLIAAYHRRRFRHVAKIIARMHRPDDDPEDERAQDAA